MTAGLSKTWIRARSDRHLQCAPKLKWSSQPVAFHLTHARYSLLLPYASYSMSPCQPSFRTIATPPSGPSSLLNNPKVCLEATSLLLIEVSLGGNATGLP